nr:MAG TPA: hypothetical protein [Caudoviricetes sp.]
MGSGIKQTFAKRYYFGVDLYIFFYLFVVFTLVYSKKIIIFLNFIKVSF